MKNIAVVIAVSEYNDPTNDLPACKQDAEAFKSLLDGDGRFEEVLYINEKLSSGKIKDSVSKFFESQSDQDIGEVLFYFTGHGEFDGSELYFLLSNFDSNRRRQTSLSNDEIDSLVRSLKPQLYSKVIDACNSGVSYIKSRDSIEMYLKSSQNSFNKLYFLFSSQSDQFSYQDDSISYFTESIIRSVLESDISPVRYKDVMSFVADDFERMGFQTPLFVVQADFTETFAGLSKDAKQSLSNYIKDDVVVSDVKRLPTASLSEILKTEAGRYCTEEQAIDRVRSISQLIVNAVDLGDLSEIYELEVEEFEAEPPQPAGIGKWLEDSTEDIKYFAKPRKETESYQRPKELGAFTNLLRLSSNITRDLEYETAYRSVVKGFENTWNAPVTYFRGYLTPKMASVAPEALFVVPIVSRTKLRVFWATAHFEYTDWDTTRRSNSLEWKTWSSDVMNEEEIEERIRNITNAFVNFVRKPLEEKWLQVTEPIALQVEDQSNDKSESE